MPSQPIPTDPKSIIDLIIKRRWFVMIPFSLAMIVGIYLSITLPRIYEASTLILIQPQRVPDRYVQAIVSADTSERISTLSQQVLSRSNLEKLIREFNLFKGTENSRMYIEDILGNLRERITIDVSRDRRGDDAFTISFRGQDPVIVMNVTNALASYFIEENLRLRELQAVGTSDFLEAESQSMKSRLEAVEVQLKDYRESYMGELPEQLDSNLRILDRLQDHLGEREQSLAEAKIRLVALQSDAAQPRNQPTTVIINPEAQQEPNNLEEMRAQLETLLSRYTKRHPDVVRLEARIAEAEKQAELIAQSRIKNSDTDSHDQPQTPILSPEFRVQKKEIMQEMQRLEIDIKDTKRQINIYKQRVENTPKREQELLSLKRDYENIKESYDSLLERKLEAEIAVNMERKQKGEQFRILDEAKLPQKPVKPDMKKLFVMVFAAGLGLGGGIIFLLEYFDNTLKRPDDIESDLKLDVLCMVPEIYTPKRKIWRTVEHVSSIIYAALSFALFAGFAIIYLNGVDKTIVILKKVISL
jgi:polysaccharide chain length determinant protein (PEP-CTERM system associated)